VLGQISPGTPQLATRQGTKLPQLVLLKQFKHAVLVFGVELQPSRQLDIVICEQHAVIELQLALQSMPELPPVPVVPPVPLLPQAPLWQAAVHWQVPREGSLHEPLPVWFPRLPLQVPVPSPKVMELPLTVPW
jgi:hypothetical protein